MSAEDHRLTIFVNTYGNLAEGRIDDLELELPMDPEALYARMAEALDIREGNDEVYVSYCDGPEFVDPNGFTDPGDLNILAALLHAHPEADLTAVAAYLDGADVKDPLRVANAVLQADEIPFERWDEGTFREWEDPTDAQLWRAYGSKLVHEAMEAGDPDLAVAYAKDALDYGEFGIASGCYCNETGYLEYDPAWNPAEEFDAAKLAEQAQEGPAAPRWSGDLPVEVNGTGLDASEGHLLPTVETRLTQLISAATAEDIEAARCIAADDHVPTLVELGSILAAKAGERFHGYDCGPLPNTRTDAGKNVALGMTLAAESIESLEATGDRNHARMLLQYIDVERLGRERGHDLALSRAGILDLAADGPDLEAFGRDELEQMAASEMHPSVEAGKAPVAVPEPVKEQKEGEAR